MKLGQSSLSNDERVTEAKRLLQELQDYTSAMSKKEQGFVEDMLEKSTAPGFFVSPNQLFWLRDLREKFCL